MNRAIVRIVAALICVFPSLLSAEEWVLGGSSGFSWNDLVQVRAQIDDQSSPGSVQIRGFTPDENIIASLNWSYGKPNDLVSEGSAALWDNSAARNPMSLTITDGDGATGTDDIFKTAGVVSGRSNILLGFRFARSGR